MTTWIIEKIKMLILNMALNFRFVCNLEKNYKCDNPNNPPIHVFTQSYLVFDDKPCLSAHHK
jgi:hypothetical protein